MESNEKTYVFSEKALDSYVKTVQKIARMEERDACARRAGVALLGADRGLTNRVEQAIKTSESGK
jgi:hypothetical protein